MSRPLRSCLLALFSTVVLSVATAAPAAAQEARTPSSEMSGFENIDGTTLRPATLTYDATIKMDGRSRDLSSTQTVAATSTGETDTWTLVNKIETARGSMTDSLIVDRSSLLPRSRHRSGGSALDITFTDTAAIGELQTRGQSVSIRKRLEGPTLAGGVHDVIALSAMPLKPGFRTTLRVFSPRDQATKSIEFETVGTETVDTPAGSFETYVVDLNVGDGYVTGTVHLRKTAPHYYVKWKTEVNAARGTRTVIQTLTSMEMSTSPGAQ